MPGALSPDALNSRKHEKVLSSGLTSHDPQVSVEESDVEEHHRPQGLPPLRTDGDETVLDLLRSYGNRDTGLA